MSNHDGQPSSDAAELARLRRELLVTKRQLEQTRRIAVTSETMATQSKRAMLRSCRDLESALEESRKAKAQAEAATHAKGRFLAMMSHELRTPLNGIIGSAEMLTQMDLPAHATEMATLLHRSGRSLLAIINDVLDYSRADAGMMTLERAAFSLPELIREVIGLQAGVAEAKGVRLSWEIADGVPAHVLGDSLRLRQVLQNLLQNALKFTVRGEVGLHVQRGEGPDMIAIRVRDTGVGIGEQAIDKLFQAFVQEDATTMRRFGGTGLGLAICKQLTQLMGGDIQVSSQLGRGSIFLFTAHLPQAEAVMTAEPTDLRPTTTAASGCAPHVLIVDDNDANRLLLRRMLQRLGCTTAEAEDGMQAVQRIADHGYDLVLMDLSMPIMDGLEATRTVRHLDAEKAAVRIVALTANAMPEDRQACQHAGMDGYLAKPVRMIELQAELRRIGITAT